MTLEQDLRRYVDGAADPVTIEEVLATLPLPAETPALETEPTLTTVRHGSHRVLVAFVLIALTAIGIGLTQLGGRSATTTAFGGDNSAFVGEWAEDRAATTQFEPSTPAATVTISEISSLSPGFFAVGAETGGAHTMGALWWSPEGNNWQRISDDAFDLEIGPAGGYSPAGISFDTIVENSGRLVLVGERTGTGISPVFFYSNDGRNWHHAPIEIETDDDTPITISGAVATENGFLVLGLVNNPDSFTGEGNTTIAWRSGDGSAWQQLIPTGFETGAYVAAVTTIENRLLAVGSVGGFGGQAAAWISDDSGVTWTRAEVQGADSDLPVSGMALVSSGPERLVAFGYRSAGDDVSTSRRDDGPLVIHGRRDPSVWYSIDDGLTWVEAPFGESPSSLELESSLTWGPAGFMLTATSISSSGMKTLAWTTADGVSLAPLAVPAAVVQVTAATAQNDQYLLATDSQDFTSIDPVNDGPISIWHIR